MNLPGGATTAVMAVDGGDLPLGGGLLALIRPAFDLLEPRGVLAVLSSSDSALDDLPAWCRLERHTYLTCEETTDGRRRHLLQRGELSVPRGKREESMSLLRAGKKFVTADMTAAIPMPERAEPATGFAPRGARVEPGGPEYPFTLLERDRVAPPEIGQI